MDYSMISYGFGAGFATVLIAYFLGKVAGFFLGLIKRS
jgi:hypothetical protein